MFTYVGAYLDIVPHNSEENSNLINIPTIKRL